MESGKGEAAMLINCSNHPSAQWGSAQLAAAEEFGGVVDLPFPQVDPRMGPEELRALTGAYAEKIEAMKPAAVFAAGEFTFLFMLVDRLLSDGIRVVCGCSRRDAVETRRADGSSEKTSVFVFERFRDYQYYAGTGRSAGAGAGSLAGRKDGRERTPAEE
ncbi:MAG: CRISPR-associated protein [Clostridia bacterium]|nr:CRISPR-associated protein [Clostridia bacterium]